MGKRGSAKLYCLLMVGMMFMQSKAVIINWQGGGADDDWSTAANWKGGKKPIAEDQVRIIDTKKHDANVMVTKSEQYSLMYLGYRGTNCVLTLDGGSLTASSSTVVGSANGDNFAWGKLVHLSGTASYVQLWLGSNPGATGIYEMVSGDMSATENCYGRISLL